MKRGALYESFSDFIGGACQRMRRGNKPGSIPPRTDRAGAARARKTRFFSGIDLPALHRSPVGIAIHPPSFWPSPPPPLGISMSNLSRRSQINVIVKQESRVLRSLTTLCDFFLGGDGNRAPIKKIPGVHRHNE